MAKRKGDRSKTIGFRRDRHVGLGGGKNVTVVTSIRFSASISVFWRHVALRSFFLLRPVTVTLQETCTVGLTWVLFESLGSCASSLYGTPPVHLSFESRTGHSV